MSACPQCGAIPRPTDKFCNTCGTPVQQAGPGGGAAPPQGGGGAYGAPAAGGYGAQAPWGGQPGGGTPRCQMGHEIAPGQSYCPQGHPMALEGMQFAGGGQFGGPPPAQGFGAPPPPQGGVGSYAAAPPFPAPAYGAAPAPQGYPPAPAQGYGGQPYPGPSQGQGGYAQQAPGGYPQPGTPQPLPGYTPPPVGGVPVPSTEPSAGAVAQPGAKVLRGFLVSYQVNANGDFWPLFTGRHTVGRSNSGEALDIPLADATISSRHALLHIDGTTGSIQIEDTGSTNGTFVNDEHLGFNGRRELRDGDRLRFGGFTTIVKVIARP
jgi:hypothetical protein